MNGRRSGPRIGDGAPGSWMDLLAASVYLGVSIAELSAAVRRGELAVEPDSGKGDMLLLLHTDRLDAWAARRR